MSTNGDMPASPVSTKDPSRGHQDAPNTWQFPGLTKRELFAAMAMQGYITRISRCDLGSVAFDSVMAADALLATLDASRPMEPKPKATGDGE